MPTSSEKIAATNINVLNAMRAGMSFGYQERIPEATKDNIAQIYDNLLNIMPLRNDFAVALITQVMYQRIETGFFENPLQVLKRDPMRYGFTEEEIFVNFARGYSFDMFATERELFKFYEANIMSAYHRLSPPIQYPVTVTYENLRSAFREEYGIMKLINSKVQSLFNGANWDEYLIMKQLLETAYRQGQIYPVNIPDLTDADAAKTMTRLIKGYIGQMTFPHPEFTIAGADSPAYRDGIYILTTPEIDAQLDVDVLAYAFDNDYVKLGAHKILVDKFDNPNIKAVLFDMRFFNVRENFRVLSDSKNGAALSWNYFYTVSEMFSYSPFFQCVVFTTEQVASAPTVTLATGLSVAKGQTIQIPVTVSASASGVYVPKNYTMKTVGDTGRTQVIPGSNILSVAKDFTGTEVTVQAELPYYDGTITATTTVAVTA